LLKVNPEEIVHIGDHPVFDYLNPRKIGINAFLLKRNEHKIGLKVNSLKNLKEILDLLNF